MHFPSDFQALCDGLEPEGAPPMVPAPVISTCFSGDRRRSEKRLGSFIAFHVMNSSRLRRDTTQLPKIRGSIATVKPEHLLPPFSTAAHPGRG